MPPKLGSTLARTADRMEVVVRLTNEGHSAAQIAVRLGVTQRSIVRLRAQAGITDGIRRVPWTPERVELFDQLLTDGWSYKEIADTHGVHPSSLSRRFPGRGWTDAQKVELREGRRRLKLLPDRLEHSLPPRETFGLGARRRPVHRQRRSATPPRAEQAVG